MVPPRRLDFLRDKRRSAVTRLPEVDQGLLTAGGAGVPPVCSTELCGVDTGVVAEDCCSSPVPGVVGVVAGGSSVAGGDAGCAASSLGAGVLTGTAGVVGCGWAVAAVGSSVVSVVTCVIGAAAGLTGAGLTGGVAAATGTACAVEGVTAAGVTGGLGLPLGEWRRRCATAATDTTAAAELIGWALSRTTIGTGAVLATEAAALAAEW
jgi:hypothetical protein